MSPSPLSSDPVVALGEAWRQARRALSLSSSTSVRPVEEKVTHTLRVGRYSTLDSMFGHGKCIESDPFRAGGHLWKLSYFPNGHRNSKSGRPSVMLSLTENRLSRVFSFLSGAAEAVADYEVSVLDVDGNPVCGHVAAGELRRYGVHNQPKGVVSGIWSDIPGATPEEGKEALLGLKDDSLVLRCNVTVQNMKKESRVKCFIRRFLD